MRSGTLDRSVQFQRAAKIDDGLQVVDVWASHGLPEPAARKDVSDGERAAAGWVEATQVSRFTVRSSDFTRALTPKDRLTCDGLTFDIQGIKEIGRRDLEITAIARADL